LRELNSARSKYRPVLPDGLPMLWWFIGFWLASGAVLPAFLLLRMAYRWLPAPKLGPMGLHVLSGLVGIGVGAMTLWIVCSFSDSSIAMRDTPSAFVVAGTPLTHAVVAAARPIQLLPSASLSLSPAPFSAAQAGPPLLSEAGQPRIDDMAQGVGGDASRQADAAAPPIAPLHRKLAHRNTHGTPVRSYTTWSSSRGVWLFGPNGNEGAHN
jgi:hypothetical protein